MLRAIHFQKPKDLIPPLILFVILLFIHLRLLPYAFDDAYIHFRIARNFVEYGVPYYNPGEMVMASSSSVWTLLLSFIFRFAPSPLSVAILNAILITIGAFVFQKLFPSYGLLSAFLYIAFMITPSIGLMETPLAILLFGLAILLFPIKHKISLILFGILPFVRIELVFASALFIGYGVIKNQFSLRSAFLFAGIGAAPFLVYDIVFFHTVIPNTVNAKLSGYDISSIDTILSILSQFFPGSGFLGGLIVLLLTPLFILLLFLSHPHPAQSNSLLFISGIMVIALYIVGRPLIFPWYAPLFTISLILPVINSITSSKTKSASVLIFVISLPLIFILSKILLSSTINPAYLDEYNGGSRVTKYIEVGKRLYKAYPTARLMTSEIGGLGWGFEGEVIDGFGLASPSAIPYHKESSGSVGTIPTQFIQNDLPEIIVSHDIFIKRFDESETASNYIHLTEPIFLDRDGELWGGTNLNIYIRSDIYNGHP